MVRRYDVYISKIGYFLLHEHCILRDSQQRSSSLSTSRGVVHSNASNINTGYQIMGGLFPVFEFWMAIVYHKELTAEVEPSYLRKHIMFNDFDTEHPPQYFYYWQYFVKRTLIAVVIVAAWPVYYFQLGMCTLLHLLVSYSRIMRTRQCSGTYSCFLSRIHGLTSW